MAFTDLIGMIKRMELHKDIETTCQPLNASWCSPLEGFGILAKLPMEFADF
ncbi:hypothetical protein [Terasakiella sp.]|uniref:hypothetical protein n=1 Tax=Terasakiella sp. TaxID=2034861 RepID=UPI003AA8D574